MRAHRYPIYERFKRWTRRQQICASEKDIFHSVASSFNVKSLFIFPPFNGSAKAI